MQRSFRQRGWRAFLLRTALLTGLWLVVAFVFGTEIYLTAPHGPVRIPWRVAAASAFHDWFPWILLSPVAVALAGRFRFERKVWRRSLTVHVAACLLFAVAYEGMLVLAYPTPLLISTGGMDGGIGMITGSEAPPPQLTGFAGSVRAVGLSSPPPFVANSNAVVFVRNRSFRTAASLSFPASSNAVAVIRDDPSSFAPPTNDVRFFFQSSRPVSKWTHFFLMALLKSQFTVPIYWCIVCICWVLNHFQETGERERRTLELESRLNQANLQTLKMQLQPHFLFNTLNAISSLVHENPKGADDMIGSLSQFLRTTLDVSSKNEVPLRMELAFVDRYLEIQETRFGDRLRIHREIDSTAMDGLVPTLILQPLVENAIRYGIESRETGGSVTIRALRKGDILHLEVADDGDGFGGGHLLGTGNGVGLSNTKARLQALYGDGHQFKLTANQPTGACVLIEIPFRLSPTDTQNKT